MYQKIFFGFRVIIWLGVGSPICHRLIITKISKVNGVNLNVKYTRDIVLQCRVGNENFTECIVCQLTLL